MFLTVTSDVKAWKLFEVDVFKALVVFVQSAHYSRPGPLEYLHKHDREDTPTNLTVTHRKLYLLMN